MHDGVELDPTSIADLKRLGEVFKASDKTIRSAISKGLREAAKPLSADVIREGADKMPASGGLRSRIAAARGGVTVSLSSSRVSVSIRAKTREGYSLRLFDRGILRHPVFGEKRTKIDAAGNLSTAWVTQKLPEHAFSEAFDRGAPQVRTRVRAAIQEALDDIARKAT